MDLSVHAAKVSALLVFSLVLAGCSAGQVRGDAFKSAYAPTNQASSSQAINYCNAGARFVRDSRREDAYRKMHATCRGKYEIIREESLVKPFAVCSTTQRVIFHCVN